MTYDDNTIQSLAEKHPFQTLYFLGEPVNIMNTMERTLHGDTPKPPRSAESTSRWVTEMRAPIDAALHGSFAALSQKEVDRRMSSIDTLHLFD